MKNSENVADTFALSPFFGNHKNISACAAKKFWQDRKAQGKVDEIFKRTEKKLKLLWQKIQDGSATDREYASAYLLVSEDELLAESSTDLNKNTLVEVTEEDEHFSEKHEVVISLDSSVNDAALPSVAQRIRFSEHKCGEQCLSEVNPYFSKSENPLRFPISCRFKRWHGKSDLLSRPLDVIYKAPCGRGLRNFDEVYSYLLQTKCRFLFLDYFSFNTFLQLERNIITGPVVAQDADISKDVEQVPVSFFNDVDNTKPSSFKYRKTPWPHGYALNNYTDLFTGCCDCTDGCLDVSTCACLQLTFTASNNVSSPNQPGTTGYKYKRLPAPIPSGIYECNVSCKCDRRMCQNRVVQHGLQVRLQVYKTKEKGWGVRCLDDLDHGTFVCIYAGQIKLKPSNVDVQDKSPCAMQTDENKSTSVVSHRKRQISLSDSEVTNNPPDPYSRHKPGDTRVASGSIHQPKNISKNTFLRLRGRDQAFPSVRRPKTKTSMLQKRRRQLMEKGEVTVQHSSEDDDLIPVSSQKPPHTKRHEGGDADRMDDVGYLSDNSSLSVSEIPVQVLASEQSGTRHHTKNEEHICVLDASKEGNVTRFLNHSCSSNLFVQSVYVETHSKKFPWVAFFTKSHINAGTELTWDYNYNIGSAPEEEIPCQCGQKTCKNITI